MLSAAQSAFLQSQRVATLATVDGQGNPHAVPVCFLLRDETVYIAIDQKPKRTPARSLKRLRNIAENPNVALLADHYNDDDWRQLGWVMLRGRAEILESGPEHSEAQNLLKGRYPQYAEMVLDGLPVIAIRVQKATSWGQLQSTIN